MLNPTNNTSSTSEQTQSCKSHQINDEYLKKLGRSVFISSNMPKGDDYVAVIGNGTENTNLEAIYTLLLRNSDQFCDSKSSLHLENALEILKDRFDSAESIFNS